VRARAHEVHLAGIPCAAAEPGPGGLHDHSHARARGGLHQHLEEAVRVVDHHGAEAHEHRRSAPLKERRELRRWLVLGGGRGVVHKAPEDVDVIAPVQRLRRQCWRPHVGERNAQVVQHVGSAVASKNGRQAESLRSPRVNVEAHHRKLVKRAERDAVGHAGPHDKGVRVLCCWSPRLGEGHVERDVQSTGTVDVPIRHWVAYDGMGHEAGPLGGHLLRKLAHASWPRGLHDVVDHRQLRRDHLRDLLAELGERGVDVWQEPPFRLHHPLAQHPRIPGEGVEVQACP